MARLAVYAVLAVAVLILAPFFGAEPLDPGVVLHAVLGKSAGVGADIFFLHRLPRVLLAFLVGGSLAVSGASLQVVLRNPLAEPFILGIAGGGAVGAVFAISVPALMITAGPFSTVHVFTLAGCLACMAAIYFLASGATGVSMNTILLAGVTFNVLCGAAILLLRYLVSPHLLVTMDRWMMGGLDVVGYRELAGLLPLAVPGVFLLFIHAPALNQLAFGEEMAAGHGVDVAKVHKQVFLGTGLATAAAVTMAGPIGFVGLVVPHAVRRLSGHDQRLVLPASFLAGGGFLTLCDLFARTVVAPTEMPVGIITAMIGGPVFLRILFKKRD
ncbi:MAG: iron ABC transporter permease [Deltaproteobacteria bacterium]|nr:iron ABC transporter permease [Deltaproteobacteria bacterium]